MAITRDGKLAAAALGVWLPSLWGRTLLAGLWLAPVGTLVTVAVALAANAVLPPGDQPG